MTKKYYIAVAMAALVITTAGVTFYADASEVDASEKKLFGGRGYELTEEVKADIDQIKDLVNAGDFEGAKVKAEELGLPMHRGKMFKGQGNPEMTNFRQSVQEAMDNNDYQSWLDLHVENGREDMIKDIDEDTFNKMNEVHLLMQSGEREAAQELADEYGLDHFGLRKGFHKGNHQGECPFQK